MWILDASKTRTSFVALRTSNVSHAANMLCPECTFPLCCRCLLTSSAQEDTAVPIPVALANDNFFGFALDIVYKYKVRYIECAEASPLFTALITY